MQHFELLRSKWPVGMHHHPDYLALELTDEVSQSVLRQMICEAFEHFPLIAITQFVDPGQWPQGDQNHLSARIGLHHGVELGLAASFLDTAAPGSLEGPFVIHVLTPPRAEVLEEAVRFGMTGVPNVIYGMPGRADWRNLTESWNRRLFQNVAGQITTEGSGLIGVVKEQGFLMLTVDGHPTFFSTEIAQVDRILRIVEIAADRWRKRPEIRALAAQV